MCGYLVSPMLLSFPHCIILVPLLKNNWPYIHWFLSGLCSVPLTYVFVFNANALFFWLLQLCNMVWNLIAWCLQLLFFVFQGWFDYLRSLLFHINILEFFVFYFSEKYHWNFDWHCIQSVGCFWYMDILAIVVPPVHENGTSFHLFVSYLN